MSTSFLNRTELGTMLAAIGRRFEGLASVDPDELARQLLDDDEFRRRVMEAIAASSHQKATNSQFGIAQGQENHSPDAWHLVSADEGLLSINRAGLEAFVSALIKEAIDALPPGGNNGTGGNDETGGSNCHCPPPAGEPPTLRWQTLCGSLKATVKHDLHMFAPFSFPKEMPRKIEFFDRLTFIPNEVRCQEKGGRRKNKGERATGRDSIRDFPVNAFDPTRDFIGDVTVNAYHPETDFVKEVEVAVLRAFDPATDVAQEFRVNAFNPAKDFISDHAINAFDPTKDFVRDYDIPVVQTVDYTQDFSVPVIRVINYTQDFAIHSLPLDEEFKFTIDTRQTDTGLDAPAEHNRRFGFDVYTRLVVFSGSIGIPYDWWIDWGDGTPLQRVSGVPQNHIPSRDPIEKTYAAPGRYQITIKPAQEFNSWLGGFSSSTSPVFSNKIVSPDSPLTVAMFAPLGSRVPRPLAGYEMFNYCRGIDFHLGEDFGFSPEWENVTGVGAYFCTRMFANSRITDIPDHFNLPQGIRRCDEFFCSGMFAMCDLIRVPSAFRFPQLYPDHRGIDQQGVLVGVFQHLDNRPFTREPIPASVIINGNPVPSSSRNTFHMVNNVRGRERWSDWDSIHSNWR